MESTWSLTSLGKEIHIVLEERAFGSLITPSKVYAKFTLKVYPSIVFQQILSENSLSSGEKLKRCMKEGKVRFTYRTVTGGSRKRKM